MLAAVYWEGAGEDLNWNNPANWSDQQLPGVDDDVTIEVSGISISHHDGQTVVNSLASSASLEILGGSFTVHATSTVSGSLVLANGASLVAEGPDAQFVANGETAIAGANLAAVGGGQLYLPQATELIRGESSEQSLTASGVGSILSLPNVSLLSNPHTTPGGIVAVQALVGGRIDLSGLSQVTGGNVHFEAAWTNSIIDVSSLTDFQGHQFAGFEITNGGRVLSESLTSVNSADILLDGTATMNTSSIVSFTGGGTLTIFATDRDFGSLEQINGATLRCIGAAPRADSLTNIDNSTIEVAGGAELTLPAVTTYQSGTPGRALKAFGADSVLSLPNLASVSLDQNSSRASLLVEASGGGKIELATEKTTLSGIKLSLTPEGFLGAGTIELIGDTAVSGRGLLVANVINSASVRPEGVPGILIVGDYTQTADGVLEIDIGDTATDNQYLPFHSPLVVAGTARLDGNLAVRLAGGPDLPTDDRFDLVAFGSREGTFERSDVPPPVAGRYWEPEYRDDLGQLSLVLAEDRDIPMVTATAAEAVVDGGAAIGIEFSLWFSKELDQSTAIDPTNYRLTESGSGEDRSELITAIEYRPPVETEDLWSEPSVVVEVAPQTGLPQGRYQLTMLGANVTDMSGNAILTGDTHVRFTFATTPPDVLVQSDGHRARAVVPPGAQSAASVVLQLSDNDLDEDQATNERNYRLERLDEGGSVIEVLPISSLVYDRYADRIMLGGFDALLPGDYRLTMYTEANPSVPGSSGIANLSGAAIDGNGDGTAGGLFIEEFSVSPGRLSGDLDEELLGGAFKSLDGLLGQSLIPLAEESRDMFAGEAFARQILEQVRLEIALQQGNDSQTVAQRINGRIEELFAEARAAHEAFNDEDAFLPYGEFIVVWGNDVRFLLQNPSTPGDVGAVGFDESGNPVELIDGAVLLDDGNGSQGLSLAIVPVNLAARVMSNELVTSDDQGDLSPDLSYRLDLQGLEPTNQAGVVAFGSEGQSNSRVFADTASSGIVEPEDLDFSDSLSGLDPIVDLANEILLERIVEATGPLGTLAENMLVLWFDPVDFVLADAQGRTSAHTQSGSYDQVPGSFYQGSGLTEMLVIPDALAGVYTLELVGVGGDYRGAVNFMQNGEFRTASFQGHLVASDNLVVQIDFRAPSQNDPAGPVTPGGIADVLGDFSPSFQANTAMSAISQAGMLAIAGGLAISSAASGDSASTFGATSSGSADSYGAGGTAEDEGKQNYGERQIAIVIATIFDSVYGLFGEWYETLGLFERLKELVPGSEGFFESLENILSGRVDDDELRVDSIDGSPSGEGSDDSPDGLTIGDSPRGATAEEEAAAPVPDGPAEAASEAETENAAKDTTEVTTEVPGADTNESRRMAVDEILGAAANGSYAEVVHGVMEESIFREKVSPPRHFGKSSLAPVIFPVTGY